MSLTQQKSNQGQEIKEVVIKASNLGVSFNTQFSKDDYKSHLMNLFRKRDKTQDVKERDFWPIKNLEFSAHKGEVLGIIGSNGSGKTTLCKLISGILLPDEGDIQVDGKVSALFSLGMGFKKELTGRENVYLNGMMLGIEKKVIDESIDKILDFSGIGKFIDKPMKYYSSGMKARLGFSVAAFMEPEILILDEALNTGDTEFSEKAALKIQELVNKAKLVIIVTHSLRYAKKYCNRLIWLEKGVIKDQGNPNEVIKKYKETLPEKKPKKKNKLELKKTEVEIKDTTVIKAENINLSFKLRKETFQALREVSFEVKEGEVIGIIGHNGAGKSTLCKVLTKILTPDDGYLKMNGETTALLNYGTGFNAQLTGSDNIFLNGMLLGIPKETVQERYEDIIDFSGIRKSIHAPVKGYSSGMKARLGFSIAATLQPDIFIIDEALSTGDMHFRKKASEKIQEMMENAKAVLIVSHSMSFVETVCTRAIWMEKGQILFDGDPQQAVRLYKEKIDARKNKV